MGGKRRAARVNWAARRAAIKVRYRDRRRGRWDKERKEKELRFQEEADSCSLEDSDRQPYLVHTWCSLCKRRRWIDPNAKEELKCPRVCNIPYHDYGCHCDLEPCWICVHSDQLACTWCDHIICMNSKCFT